MRKFYFIGWSRQQDGNDVKRYLLKTVCNTITSFSGGGHRQRFSNRYV